MTQDPVGCVWNIGGGRIDGSKTRDAASVVFENNKTGFENFAITHLPTNTVEERARVERLTGFRIIPRDAATAAGLGAQLAKDGTCYKYDSERYVQEKSDLEPKLDECGMRGTRAALANARGYVVFRYAKDKGLKSIHVSPSLSFSSTGPLAVPVSTMIFSPLASLPLRLALLANSTTPW